MKILKYFLVIFFAMSMVRSQDTFTKEEALEMIKQRDAQWEGIDLKGRVLPNGVYLYHISLLDYNGKNWVYNGELNLIK